MRVLLAIAFLCCVGLTYSQDKNGEIKGKKTGTEQRNAKNPTVVVNVLPPQLTLEEAESNKKEKEEKSNLDRELVRLTGDLAKYTDDLALFTKILAGVAFLQLLVFGYQGWMLKRTIQSTERTERAEIYAKDIEPAIFPHGAYAFYSGGSDAPWPRMLFSFMNFGRTSAVITRVRTKMILSDVLPPEPNYGNAVSQEGETVIGNGANTPQFRETLERHLTLEEITQIREEKMHIFLFGHVKYKDIYNTRHVYAFCVQFRPRAGHPEGGIVSVAGGEEYNYRRKET